MPFDFDAAVQAPFRMQPGLRRMAPGAAHLTPLAPGSRHQREKLAVLSAFAPQALLRRAGFDARPALHALARHAAAEHPQAFSWDGRRAEALLLSTAVECDAGEADDRMGEAVEAQNAAETVRVVQMAPGRFGLGDEVARCLQGLPAGWRLAGLVALAFAEDFAIVDARDGTVPWLAVTLPSHWAPEEKVGRHFAAVHAPVADNALLLKASDSLVRLVSGADAGARWERFVWTVTDHPRLHAHPARLAHPRWRDTPVERAWWRTERQTFIPLPEMAQAIFTIEVALTPLAEAVADPARARALHAAIASMSEAVLAYRGLAGVREPLLACLAERACTAQTPAETPATAPGETTAATADDTSAHASTHASATTPAGPATN
ncbi:MAG: DUF3445 domain-containing protein [Burkholderiales bacterium]|nr:DUF3445 domain-containing protein [Burkholderiales bacterium]